MKRIVLIIITLFMLTACKEDPDHTSKICDENGCITCKTYDNYDGSKSETKCTGTGEYAAMYAGEDEDGVVVEEDSTGL